MLNQDNSETKERIIHRNVTEHQCDIATPLSLLLCSFVVPRLPRESIACNRNRRLTHCAWLLSFFLILSRRQENFSNYEWMKVEKQRNAVKNHNRIRIRVRVRPRKAADKWRSLKRASRKERTRAKCPKKSNKKRSKQLRANGEIN